MASIIAEYQRFLASLAVRPVADDVRRMANLVLNNLPFLAEVGATRRARSTRLAPIAAQHLPTTSSELPAVIDIGTVRHPLGRAHELRVGPFRGFMRPETFDLSRNLTLVYGPNPPSKNYVLLARQAFDNDDKRDALRYARPAIESLTDRLWTWMGRQGDGRIELKLGGPRSPWELNNKCSKLRVALGRLPHPPAVLTSSLASLDLLLGVGGGSIEWGYLNGGTHDSQRDGEFDRATVSTIVDAITALDQGLAELQRRR